MQKGDAVTARDEIELPDGWEWVEIWDVDLNRAVDEEGSHVAAIVWQLLCAPPFQT